MAPLKMFRASFHHKRSFISSVEAKAALALACMFTVDLRMVFTISTMVLSLMPRDGNDAAFDNLLDMFNGIPPRGSSKDDLSDGIKGYGFRVIISSHRYAVSFRKPWWST
jgi:hypothetical protein